MNAQLFVKFIKFGLIGVGVFFFDAACFWLMLRVLGNPVAARVVSVLLAITLSWALNRHFTFHAGAERRGWSELLRFGLSQLPGACANALVSVLAFQYLMYAKNNPWLSVACGSAAGLVLNFAMANFFVFKKTAPKP